MNFKSQEKQIHRIKHNHTPHHSNQKPRRQSKIKKLAHLTR